MNGILPSSQEYFTHIETSPPEKCSGRNFVLGSALGQCAGKVNMPRLFGKDAKCMAKEVATYFPSLGQTPPRAQTHYLPHKEEATVFVGWLNVA